MYDVKNEFQRSIWFLISILFINLILISTQIVLPNNKSLLQNIIITLTAPVRNTITNSLESINNAINKYIFLRNYHQKYLQSQEEIKRLKFENSRMARELLMSGTLALINMEFSNYIVADVIVVDLNFPLSSLIINKGKRHQIVKNMTVISPDGNLVGKTVEPITHSTAKVRLITSSIGGVGAYIQSNQLEGFLTGNNKKCFFKYVIGNEIVKVGEQIISSGTDNIFPPYIPIGIVLKVTDDYLEKEVIVDPYFTQKTIKHLIILKNEK